MDHRFQIHLRGIIDLLSNHLYSGPQVYLRELLQNAVDAITARNALERTPRGEIRVSVLEHEGGRSLVFEDEGIGLTEEEVHRFLATIGESSKRGDVPERGRSDFLGQFGIGLLSCFVVSDEITVVSRSAREPDAKVVEWRGRPDGTYSTEVLSDRSRPAGTTVVLRAKKGREEFFDPKRVSDLIEHFGALLPWPVRFTAGDATRVLNEHGAPWRRSYESPREQRDAILAYGEKLFGLPFLDWVPLKSEAGDVDGVAFVLPFSPNLAQKRTHRVYLKGMLLSEEAGDLLPDWAFFVRAVVNANGLRPTASREAFYEDAALEKARETLGKCLRDWLMDLAKNDRMRLQQLIALHHMAIKSLAANDDDLFKLFIEWLPFETSVGTLAFGEIARRQKTIRYTPSVDEFRQMAPVATSQGMVLVNAGYAYDHDLIGRVHEVLGIEIEKVDASRLADDLEDLSLEERERTTEFVDAAEKALEPYGCEVLVRKFRPDELPTFYGATDGAAFRRSITRAKEASPGLWSDMLSGIEAGRDEDASPQLCFNYRNALIRKLAALEDPTLIELSVQMLYVQALLLGHHPLNAPEMELLSNGLLGLIEWSADSRTKWLQ